MSIRSRRTGEPTRITSSAAAVTVETSASMTSASRTGPGQNRSAQARGYSSIRSFSEASNGMPPTSITPHRHRTTNIVVRVLVVGDHPDARPLEGGDAPRRQGVPRHVEHFEVLQVGAGGEEAGALVGHVAVADVQGLQPAQDAGLDDAPARLVAERRSCGPASGSGRQVRRAEEGVQFVEVDASRPGRGAGAGS